MIDAKVQDLYERSLRGEAVDPGEGFTPGEREQLVAQAAAEQAFDEAVTTEARRIVAEWSERHPGNLARRIREEGVPAASPTAVKLSDIDGTAPPPLWLDRLDPRESTILFGPGGIGKGALACSWTARMVADGRRVLILDYEHHGGEWRRRIEGIGGPDTLDSVLWIAPLFDGLGPIWTHAQSVRDLIAAESIDFVVIDSAVMACGGQDPLKPETPGQFNAALQLLGVPTLTLAHVTKGHDERYPFGSVFWHNLARATWSLMPKGPEIILTCQKASNYEKPAPQAVTMTWWEGALREITERPAAWTLADRIADVLREKGGPMSPAQVAAALNEGVPEGERTNRNSVGHALKRGLGRPGCAWTVDAAGLYLAKGGAD